MDAITQLGCIVCLIWEGAPGTHGAVHHLLAAGGSDTPQSLLRPMGVDIEDPQFWQLGLQPFSNMVEEVERLAG